MNISYQLIFTINYLQQNCVVEFLACLFFMNKNKKEDT